MLFSNGNIQKLRSQLNAVITELERIKKPLKKGETVDRKDLSRLSIANIKFFTRLTVAGKYRFLFFTLQDGN